LEAIEAQELIDKVSALELRIAGAKGSLAVVEKTIPEEQAIYTKAVQQREKYEKNMKFRADVATCRTIFQRDNLPTELAKNGMLALAAQMNMSLSAFSANFRVSAGSGSTFQVSFFADGVKGNQPEARLSGGERAQFGLALRVAVHSLWAQELGFLAMDEPTYGFGQNDMGCVKIAIEQLRDMSRAQGLQVIVVTHEKSLLPLFDHVIRIGM
jgi:DNA repair exonuclease SbcCD ATPase subunit